MPTFVLLKNDVDIVDQRWFATGEFPDQPNPVKKLYWYILQEIYPTPTDETKIGDYVFTIDHDQGIATKTYQLVPKTQEELDEEARIAQKLEDIITNLPTWSQVDTAITNIASLADAKVFLRKLSRVVYWLAKDTAN